MAKAKKDGKFRFAGITTHSNEPEVIHAAVDTKFYDVILTAYNYQQKHVAEVGTRSPGLPRRVSGSSA